MKKAIFLQDTGKELCYWIFNNGLVLWDYKENVLRRFRISLPNFDFAHAICVLRVPSPEEFLEEDRTRIVAIVNFRNSKGYTPYLVDLLTEVKKRIKLSETKMLYHLGYAPLVRSESTRHNWRAQFLLGRQVDDGSGDWIKQLDTFELRFEN